MAENNKYFAAHAKIMAHDTARIMQNGSLNFQQKFDAGQIPIHHNHISGVPFKGMNAMQLDKSQFADPRWLTNKQIEAQGLEVESGAKPVRVNYWQFEKTNKETGQKEKLNRPIFRSYDVINGSEVKGLEPYQATSIEPKAIDNVAEKIADAQKLLNHDQGVKGTNEHELNKLRVQLAEFAIARDTGSAYEPTQKIDYDKITPQITEKPTTLFKMVNRDAEAIAKMVVEPEKQQEIIKNYAHSNDAEKAQQKSQAQSQEKGQAMINQNLTWYELNYEENQGRLITKLNDPIVINNKEYNVAFIDPEHDVKFTFDNLDESKFNDMVFKHEYNHNTGNNDLINPILLNRTDNLNKMLDDQIISERVSQAQSQEKGQAMDKQSAKDAPRHYLDVPKEEKDEAKALGAKWDGKAKSWYINPDDHERDKFRWADKDVSELQQAQEKPKGKQPSQVSKDVGYVQKDVLSKEEEFSRFLADKGIMVDNPIFDGKVHRAREASDKGRAQSASYVAFDDGGAISGSATNHRRQETSKWVYSQQSRETTQTNDKRKQYKQQKQANEAERQAKHEQGAKRAYGLYTNAEQWADKTNTPYLANKNVKGHGLKLINGHDKIPDGTALMPVRNIDGRIVGGQLLLPEKNDKDIDKLFLPGTAKTGNFHMIDHKKSVEKADKPLVIAEGYATGASIHEATKLPVAVAFDAGNLSPVAEKLREKYPDKQLIIASDNDLHLDNNVGLEKAQKASKKVNAQLISPSFNDDEKKLGLSDFNDLANSRGHDALKEAFKDHVTQPKKKSKQTDLEIA